MSENAQDKKIPRQERRSERRLMIDKKVNSTNDWLTSLQKKVDGEIITNDERNKIIARSMIAREIQIERLAEKSKIDPLTGIPNRRAFNEEYDRVIRNGSKLGLLVIDIDDFKNFNEAYGYLTGDNVLVQIALNLNANLRQFRENEAENDILYRWGGEEFVTIVKNISKKEDLEKVAEKLRKSICERSFSVKVGDKNTDIPITVSVGGSIYRGEDKDLFFDTVDKGAVKEAKKLGKNRTVIIGE
ncbi:MAG: GGDEF domain-containing protein [Candidatus Levybacteria bacterium]|nr:GGDEF domain-containing protein [Candidatus Levybacteria bacterium]MDZ4227966.1 GGDEF domain-containing protein [Candidatus Levybacteria bacterium]